MSSYETERTTVESRLNNIFNNKDENNFIDLSAIHALVAPHDKRPTVRLLNSAKLQQVVQRIRGNGVEPICETRKKVMVHPDLALEVVKAKRGDLKEFFRRWEGGDISHVICNTPEVLSRVKDVFGDASCIRHVKLDGKFYFAAVDLAKIALWEGNASEISNIPVYIQRASEKDEALKKALAKCHRFGPGQPSPILDITDAARLWMLLPGRRATVFRTEVIKTWVRVFAGDLTLVDEIIRNHAVQESLPEDSPMRAFTDAADSTERGMVHVQSQLVSLSTQVENLSAQFTNVIRDVENSQISKTREFFEEFREIKTLIQTQQFEQMDHTSGITMDCVYHHLERSITAPSTSGITDYDFRVEFHGFILAVADILFTTLGKRHANDTAGFLEEALNISVDFGDTVPRKWSSLSVRALLQTGTKLRTRYWICQRRGLAYPNAAVNKEIQHSTYLDLNSYYSIIAHIRRVWDDHQYDGELALARMMDVLVWKFGGDIEPGDIDLGLTVLYGARKARTATQHQPASSQRTIDAFFHHQDETEPVLERRKRARLNSELGV